MRPSARLKLAVGELLEGHPEAIDLGEWLVKATQIEGNRRALKATEALTPPDGVPYTGVLAVRSLHDSLLRRSRSVQHDRA
jgi:hypothetical protein